MDFTKLSPHKPQEVCDGPVRHLDGAPLTRPFDPPKPVLTIMAIAAVAATIIGGVWAWNSIDTILHESEREAAAIQENISRGVSYDLPIMENYIALDDASIQAAFAEAGFIIYDLSEEDDEGLDLMKLPSDTTLADAVVAYARGISNMNAATASKYLVGSWRFVVSHTNGTEMKVRYCDLSAQSAQDALQTAMEAEGWLDNANVTISAEGVDSFENTYREGTIETDSGTYDWRISVCDLDGVYSISGLPDTAQYVSIRMS